MTDQDTALPPAAEVAPPAPAPPGTSGAGDGTSGYPPGSAPHHRGRVKVHWELLACSLHGHRIVGTEAAAVGPEHQELVREWNGRRWHRCLRCDSWLPLPNPEPPPSGAMPARDAIQVPLRGKPLRDRFVLRLIAVDRVIHFLVLGALAAAIFLFAGDRQQLKGTYTRILNAIQGAVGGPLFDTKHNRLVGDINHLFTLSTTKLYLYGIAVALYAALNAVEAVGLWRARRWAEYLTFTELFLLLPIEVYELTVTVTTLKSLTLALNLVIVLYLLIAKRLFGLRGGGKIEHALREHDSGWQAVDRATPPFATQLGSPQVSVGQISAGA